MNTDYRYILEKGSRKHICPQCSKRRFVRYIDNETGEYLPGRFGKCDRQLNCSYHLNPYLEGYSKAIWERESSRPQQPKPKRKLKTAFIPTEILNRTLAGYDKNVFIQNLLSKVAYPFSVEDVEKVISLYYLGTVQNGYCSGAITFPFIDEKNCIRTIQVKQFDETNNTTGTDFLHSIINKHCIKKNKPLPRWLNDYNKNELKVSCLFGEHLLNKYPYNLIALVEAPKTAIYGTLYFGFPGVPSNLLWLAVYNLSSLNTNKCKALHGRDVYLFPDLSKDSKAFELWSNKATELQQSLPGTYFQVSDLLEQFAHEQDRSQGKDIADYLIQLNWRQFRNRTHFCEKSEKGETHTNTFFYSKN